LAIPHLFKVFEEFYCYVLKKSRLFLSLEPAEHTVQHEETPHPPPPKPPAEDENPASALEQQKADITFFTSPEPHFVQDVSFSVAPTL
jgi:hypothetical protein